MKNTFFVFLFICSLMQAQSPIYLKDSRSNIPVSYANIWKEDKMYATSDSLGVFKVDDKYLDSDFKISAIGYKTTHFIIKNTDKILYLETEAIQLNEVSIVKRMNKDIVNLGKARRGTSSYAVQFDDKTGMCAKYFPNQFNKGFINKVKFCATSSAKNRTVNLIFYSVGENGEPDKILNTENKIIRLKKGTHVLEVDVSDLDFEFPKEGLFVVVQHLLLEENKNYAKPYYPNAFFYEPTIAIDYSDGYKDTWYFKEGKWQKNNRFSINMEISISN